MVVVAPFKGVVYNKEKIRDLDDVMSPPYDIISPVMQDELYKKSEYNVVRLILGKRSPEDDEKNNCYTRAKRFLDSWLEQGVLVENKTPAIYPYKVEYEADGKKKVMNGFFVLLKLDHEYRMVKAHEKTLSKPKEDRLNLMRATKANLEPIELLYIDESDAIRKKVDAALGEPEIDVVGYDGFRHMLWKIEDQNLINEVQQMLREEVLFIADGHHRYQTAINYAREVGAKENDPENYIMVVLANMFDKGLSILPTHRLIKMDVNLDELLENSKQYFEIEEVDLLKNLSEKEKAEKALDLIKTEKDHKFLLYDGDKGYLFTLKDEKVMDDVASDHSKTWRTLDVSILHRLLLEKVMGIDESNLEDHVKYTRDTVEAVRVVDEGGFDFSIIMNPTRIEELKAVADAGEHMPQKSTYFLPKLLSGLVMRRFR
ncbi:MAG: DUF1015 domain-containing protein [Thermoplasmata archaeon]|nr:DUF1015 domain-containing protein [Thermoplasmata archaeon]